MPRGYGLDGKKLVPPSQKGVKRSKPAWNKGKFGIFSHSDDTKEKISIHHKENCVGIWLKGLEITEEKRENLRKAALLNGSGKWNAGKKYSLERRIAHSKSVCRGELHHGWKGGISPENEKVRKSLDYKLWREAVFARDNFTCTWCGLKSGCGKAVTLNADHIKPFAYFPELRFEISNGRTLCVDCHRKTDTYGPKVNKLYA